MRHDWDILRVRRGLTLLEVLVAMVLSILVLGMVFPMLTGLLRPSSRLDIAPTPTWMRALETDLQELVSPAKCANPIVRVVAASGADAMPRLVLDTFSRVGDKPNIAAVRGPNEVCYRLISAGSNGPYALVREAQGWHDELATRLVVADKLTGWSIEPAFKPTEEVAATQPSGRDASVAPLPQSLQVELFYVKGEERLQFSVPEIENEDVASTQAATEPETRR